MKIRKFLKIKIIKYKKKQLDKDFQSNLQSRKI